MLIHNADELALFFKSYRKASKKNQRNLAHSVGLKQTTISAFENKPNSTKLETLFRILAASGLQIHIQPKTDNTDQTWTEEW